MNPEQFSAPEKKEVHEYGKNVSIQIKFIRHGERDKDGNLQDIGRDITRQRAQESGLTSDDFDAVKAIGSDASPTSPETGMQRSLETAHIYAQEIAGEDAFNTRINRILNYETLATEAPYDHKAIYNSHLPENFDDLDPESKVEAAKIANAATINHIFHLEGEQADNYRKEVAGTSAHIIDHYIRMSGKLKSDSRVLIPAGGHGGLLEFLLQQTLVFTNKEGKRQTGFSDLSEVGGDINPSEAFNVMVETDDEGQIKDLKVSFDRVDRPKGDMYLDMDKVKELSKFYQSLHKEE